MDIRPASSGCRISILQEELCLSIPTATNVIILTTIF